MHVFRSWIRLFFFPLAGITLPNFSAWLHLLQTSFLVPNILGKLKAKQSPEHYSKFFKQLSAIRRGESITQPSSSVWLKVQQAYYLVNIRKGGVLPNQTTVQNYKCCKSPSHYQVRSLTEPNFSACLQVLQTSFLVFISQGKELLNQTQVHCSTFLKPLFSLPLKWGSPIYPTKDQCMIPNFLNVFYRYH